MPIEKYYPESPMTDPDGYCQHTWIMYFLDQADKIVSSSNVPGGGTGLSNAAAGGVLYGQNASPLGVTSAPTSHQVLEGAPGNIPRWTTWSQVRQTVNAAETLTVDVGFGTTVAGPVTNAGTVSVAGTLAVTGSLVSSGTVVNNGRMVLL